MGCTRGGVPGGCTTPVYIPRVHTVRTPPSGVPQSTLRRASAGGTTLWAHAVITATTLMMTTTMTDVDVDDDDDDEIDERGDELVDLGVIGWIQGSARGIPGWSRRVPEGSQRVLGCPGGSQRGPRGPWEASGGSQRGSQRGPRGLGRGSRGPRRGPRRDPRGPGVVLESGSGSSRVDPWVPRVDSWSSSLSTAPLMPGI